MKQQTADVVNPFGNIYFKFVFASGSLEQHAVREREGEIRHIISQPRPEARNTLASVGPVFVSLLQADLRLHH